MIYEIRKKRKRANTTNKKKLKPQPKRTIVNLCHLCRYVWECIVLTHSRYFPYSIRLLARQSTQATCSPRMFMTLKCAFSNGIRAQSSIVDRSFSILLAHNSFLFSRRCACSNTTRQHGCCHMYSNCVAIHMHTYTRYNILDTAPDSRRHSKLTSFTRYPNTNKLVHSGNESTTSSNRLSLSRWFILFYSQV